MASYTREDLRIQLVKAERLLREIYKLEGPRGAVGNGALRISEYAKMTRKEVDENYNFPHRHLMHRIARLLDI
jgi:hypothetical protein